MADDITYTSTSPAGPPDATKQATDEHATRGHMPLVKLAYSADGSATLVTADADGLLVNLGTNNDVSLNAGTNAIGKLSANSGVDIGDVDVTSVPADPFGVNADAASATGSISAKLRFIAVTGIPITAVPAVTSATLANVSASASNVTLLSSNAARKGAMIANDSASAVYVKFGATASTTSFTVKIAPYGYYEFPAPCYTGIVDGIWDTATGSARTTEV